MKLIIQNSAFQKLAPKLRLLGSQIAIITDEHVAGSGKKLLEDMRRAGIQTRLILIPAGDKAKSLAFVERAAGELVKQGLKRDSGLIALGGGAICDFTGFLASIYMRGIELVLIPTTLLAMTDSCIGGKNGVNLEAGKNLLGTFYAPRIICIDPLFLKSLPGEQFASGMAEVIKHGVILDRQFFGFLRKNCAKILARDPALLQKIIRRSVQIKMKIVAADEKESLSKAKKGLSRMLLNYGHTVGHALEKLSQFELPHGQAVAIGMVAENRIAVSKKILKQEDASLIMETLAMFHLPVKIPPKYRAADIKRAIFTDKKNISGKLYFALPTKIGQAKIFPL